MEREEKSRHAKSFPEWNTTLPRCQYRIVSIQTPEDEQIPFLRRSVIEAVPGSVVEWYDPMDTLRNVNSRSRAYQPRELSEDSMPPHVALANLKVREDAAIERFCTQYGLLGLREIPHWKNRYQLAKVWWQSPIPDPRPPGWHHVQTYREPLDLFEEAVEEFQQVYGLLDEMRMASGEKKQSLALDVQLELLGDLNGCTIRPIFNGEKWILGYQFRSLLDVCYFRLVLDMVQSEHKTPRRCSNCGAFFIASRNQEYCSERCRKSASVARLADRTVKRKLNELYARGCITRELLDEARAEVNRLYDRGNPNGIKNAEVLDSEIAKFIKSRLESRSSDLSPRKDDEHGTQARKR